MPLVFQLFLSILIVLQISLKQRFSEENYVPPTANWVGKHAY